MADSIEMLFSMAGQVGPKSYVWVHIPMGRGNFGGEIGWHNVT